MCVQYKNVGVEISGMFLPIKYLLLKNIPIEYFCCSIMSAGNEGAERGSYASCSNSLVRQEEEAGGGRKAGS